MRDRLLLSLVVATIGRRVRLDARGRRIFGAFGICIVTYVAIAASHLVARRSTWDETVPAEAGNLLFWAVVTTAWWVYFCLLVVLATESWVLERRQVAGQAGVRT